MKALRVLLMTAALLGLLMTGAASAQGWLWGLTYEMSAPVGDLKEFSQNSWSWRGAGFEGRTFTAQEVSVGFAVSWNVFHSKQTNVTWSQPGQDVTGTQVRDVNAVPIYANMFWNWGERHGWRPFLGMNAGTMYTEYRVDLGLYSFRERNWHFAFAPEVGIRFPYDRWLGYFSVRWNYALGAGEIDEVSYISFRVGVGLR